MTVEAGRVGITRYVALVVGSEPWRDRLLYSGPSRIDAESIAEQHEASTGRSAYVMTANAWEAEG